MTEALKNLLYRMADDALILAHRHSEWTGLGPLLEEDIAFSSIAQDKLGHAQALYTILHGLGEPEPDTTAFMRNAPQFTCCQFVELPNGEYDFSLVRHYLYDAAEVIRYRVLSDSTYQPLAALARKVSGELKYHLYHARTWFVQLAAKGSEESAARMQSALNEAWPYALGMFEPVESDAELISQSIYPGEDVIRSAWLEAVRETLSEARLVEPSNVQPVYGGRKGYHTDELQPLLDEMTEVFRIDPSADW
jgi:ring-1,2-phenylacetyl-CoA epoxidase subunit PaaC